MFLLLKTIAFFKAVLLSPKNIFSSELKCLIKFPEAFLQVMHYFSVHVRQLATQYENSQLEFYAVL